MAKLDLVKLAAPLDAVILPNGRELSARPLDAEGWAMLKQVQETHDSDGALLLLQRCLPDATPEDLATLGIEDVTKIVLYCARQIAVAEDVLGESSAGAVTPSPASPPRTTSSRSARGSRARSAPTSSPSTVNPTT
jgi:hypothetical protein